MKTDFEENELPNMSEDEFGFGIPTPIEALEAHLESGKPISEEDAGRLIKGKYVSKKDLEVVSGGFEYVGDQWKI